MKVRRRFATAGRFQAWLDALRARLRGAASAPGEPEPPDGSPAEPALAASSEPATGGERPPRWPFDRRESLVLAGVLGGAFLVGYVFAALVLFPAPIFAGSTSVPRVLGSDEDRARETLTSAGFGVGSVEREPHPTVPAGAVIWQDPPAEVVAPEATEVSLLISSGPQRVPVPDIAGYDATHARMLLEAAGLRIGSTESTQAPTPRNVAVNTRPPAGTPIPPGAEVVLVVSVGAATIRVPTLTGMTVEEARLALETAGLSLGTAFGQTSSTVAPGEIFYQEPSAGTLSAPGSVVNVRFARSP